MYEDILPHYLAIGVDYNLFMESNPYELTAFDKAYKLKRQMRDEENWMLGQYMMSAFGTVLSCSFSKKSKAKYVKQPFLMDEKDVNKAKELSDIATMTKWAEDMQRDNKLPPTIFKDIKVQGD